ncbi:MAG: class I SAM-dependent methyltransferase [Pyrinomonadaceae bacterium]|nr:class I SAM-dependent methyltransferase [Pyrinomonadaceae bacterium]
MDKMYRYQRHFYDLTRKYYLFGRDKMIAEMNVQQGERVLEVGCGTCRNLILLAKKYKDAHFYGLDASAEMLITAQAKIDAAGLTKQITLRQELAEDLDAQKTFNLSEPFDAIFFSYSITMIPTWRESIAAALDNIKDGHSIYIVDFWDQKDLPAWFRAVLKNWLKQFHVNHWADLMPHLESLQNQGLGELSVTSIFKRYSFLATFKKK